MQKMREESEPTKSDELGTDFHNSLREALNTKLSPQKVQECSGSFLDNAVKLAYKRVPQEQLPLFVTKAILRDLTEDFKRFDQP